MPKEKRPPKSLEWLLDHILPHYVDETALGDFEEEYTFIASERGTPYANFWYLLQIIKSIPPFLINKILWSGIMLKNYAIIALRDLKKNKIYSFINIFGLAIGMACCIMIMLFVQNELSYDRFHENANCIYRITSKRKYYGIEDHTTITRWIMGPNLVNNFPEVMNAVRLIIHGRFVVEHGDKRLMTDPFYADPSILDVFTFPLIKGDKRTALKEPNNAVISEELAGKVFGTEDPMGKIISVYDLDDKYDLQITGILKNIPSNSHFRFDFLAPIDHLKTRKIYDENAPKNPYPCITYIHLNENANPEELQEKLPDFVSKYFSERHASNIKYFLQPLLSIHLNSNLSLELEKNSNITYSYALSVIAFIILSIACINFINLSTARAPRRSREIGMRKVIGANRLQLFKQFIGETVFLSFIALLIAIFLTALFLPSFNSLMNRHLTMNFNENLFLYIGLILLTLFVGCLSGTYPAIVLSSFQPIKALRRDFRKGTVLGTFMRKGLVVFQFVISLIFLIGTIIIFQQLNFIKNKDLGFIKDNVIEIPIYKDNALCRRADLIKKELSQHPNIIDIVVTAGIPGAYNGIPIHCVPEGFSEDNPTELDELMVEAGFFGFFGIEFIEGRGFSKKIVSDSTSSVIINETAAKSIGWKNPIGKQIKSKAFVDESNKTGLVTVIGVVKDFHNGTLHDELKPSIYKIYPPGVSEIYIRIRPENIQETIAFLERKWRDLPTHLPFNYQFLDDFYEAFRYTEDKKISKVFALSSILAIFLACFGMFGSASYSAERRKKESGIRKVLGASVSKIVLLISKEFIFLILIANIVAWPLGYYISNRWLQSFAYQTSIGVWAFIFASVLALMVALISVSYQSVKAAIANPIDSLRYE